MKSRRLWVVFLIFTLMAGFSTLIDAAVVQTLDIGAAGDDDAPQTAAASIAIGTWSGAETVDSHTARRKLAGGNLGAFTITVPSSGGGTLWFTYKDDPGLSLGGYNLRVFLNHLDGGTWEDELIGILPFDGLNLWRTVGLPLSEDLYSTYLANIGCLDDSGDTPWICDFSSAGGWQAYFNISVAPAFGDPPDEVYFDKIEIDDSKQWVFDIGDNADVNVPDTDPWYIAMGDRSKWSAITTIGSRNCRLTQPGVDAPFYHTFDSDIQTLSITVYDDDAGESPGVSVWADYQNGGTWKDLFIGNISLDGSGGWETTTLAVPAALYASGGDARSDAGGVTDCTSDFNIPGHQVMLRIWDYDASAGAGDPPAFEGDLAIDNVTVFDGPYVTPSPTTTPLPTPTPSPTPTFTPTPSSTPITVPSHDFDLVNNDYYMLIGEGCRGAESVSAWYGGLYGLDNYDVFEDLFAADGFNSFIFMVNRGGPEGKGYVSWDTAVDGWMHHPDGRMDSNLDAAENASIVAVGETLVAAISNEPLALLHPDWKSGYDYMGPWLCSNSPYWDNHLLPLYTEFFTLYGSRIAAFVLWEGPWLWCTSQYCLDAFAASGMGDYDEWKRVDKREKYAELAAAMRATGWTGKIIGGGWAAYEWEEEMWDQTAYARRTFSYNLPELEAFQDGSIDIIMPELLIHSDYGAHPYRRTDVHYVYRSLMYERSFFGKNIIPNVETYWERTMTPDELFRWMLECWSAGYSSYSMVWEFSLYLGPYSAQQEIYRENHQDVFRAFHDIPSLGKPWPNFQFIVSMGLEEQVYGWGVWDWYVDGTNRLFKEVDRAVCGGALVNEKVTALSDADLYGIVSDEMPRILIIPEGCPVPDVGSATNVLTISVPVSGDIESNAQQIIDFVNLNLNHEVRDKSSLVYVNWSQTDGGTSYISVINHDSAAGTVELKLAQGDVTVLIDSETVVGDTVSYSLLPDGWLHVDLGPYAGVAFEQHGGLAVPIELLEFYGE